MAGANHFALLESNDPGDTRLADLGNKNQQQQPAANLTQELFGTAYPSAWKVIRKRERQHGGAVPANARDGATTGGAWTDKKKGAGLQDGARKQQGGAAANDQAPAPRLYDPAQFPSLDSLK
ncbi:hypothetical protein HU200_031695 [Digitaria exilis]|uniref:Uncharacterized protein n=1 Tax=Digitaria exilis TaxID=1010633 RepID=A0A835C123_9POAL|nr:hypothetical protein HU200_031695 [Digitaria exilis]CAB3485052.1 unnamed protein product [Digitaria exilis]